MIGGAIRVLLASAIVICCEEVDEYLARRRGKSHLRVPGDAFYNRSRLHSSLGSVSPESYEEAREEEAAVA
jgi:transposase InsO family protein